jgi:glycosyltransferase involved in cell wall biosynthesis
LALYDALRSRGAHITLVTYGGRDDAHALPPASSGMRVLCNRWRLPTSLYARLLPLLHRRALRGADVFKSNQTNGAEVALRAARSLRRPLVARCGYMWSEFEARQHGADSQRARHARGVEQLVFSAAQRVVVTTEAMCTDVETRVPSARGRVEVIPNYVDTQRLRPRPELRRRREIVFVGRLTEQKNLDALLEAVSALDAHLTVAGQGPLQTPLERRARELGCAVTWLGTVEHARLAEIYNRGEVFVLPSRYEGHPKTLIEAMACGVPVVGTRVPGIEGLLRDGVDGVLCAPGAPALRAALASLLGDKALRERLGAAARQRVLDQFSLERVVGLELGLMRGLLAAGAGVRGEESKNP